MRDTSPSSSSFAIASSTAPVRVEIERRVTGLDASGELVSRSLRFTIAAGGPLERHENQYLGEDFEAPAPFDGVRLRDDQRALTMLERATVANRRIGRRSVFPDAYGTVTALAVEAFGGGRVGGAEIWRPEFFRDGLVLAFANAWEDAEWRWNRGKRPASLAWHYHFLRAGGRISPSDAFMSGMIAHVWGDLGNAALENALRHDLLYTDAQLDEALDACDLGREELHRLVEASRGTHDFGGSDASAVLEKAQRWLAFRHDHYEFTKVLRVASFQVIDELAQKYWDPAMSLVKRLGADEVAVWYALSFLGRGRDHAFRYADEMRRLVSEHLIARDRFSLARAKRLAVAHHDEATTVVMRYLGIPGA